jgi:hypothetical protein
MGSVTNPSATALACAASSSSSTPGQFCQTGSGPLSTFTWFQLKPKE